MIALEILRVILARWGVHTDSRGHLEKIFEDLKVLSSFVLVPFCYSY